MDQARLQQEYNALNPVFDPQRQIIQQELSMIPGQTTAAKTALEQAKVNAFRDITSSAQGRGVYFSGFRPSEEARYTGEKFLPALAGVEAAGMQQQTALQKALADIAVQQRQQATGVLESQLAREQQQAQFERELQAKREADARSYAASTAKSAAKAPSKSQIYTSANEDVAFLFEGYDPKNADYRGYTEKTVLRELAKAYPELSPQEISKLVYGYRKNEFGE